MRLTVSVRDVNRAPVPSADVSINAAVRGPGNQVSELITHLRSEQPFEVQLAVNRMTVIVTETDFTDESFWLSEVGGRWMTDNPACSVTTAGADVSVVLTLGCVRFAPTIYLPDGQKVNDNPRAAYLQRTGGGDWMYRGGWLNPETIQQLTDPVFGDPDGMEWERLAHRPASITLKDRGVFSLLEWGFPVGVGRRQPRFLLLVWVPRQPLGPVPQVLTFFSPTTSAPAYPPDKWPFIDNYPYAYLPVEEKPPLDPKSPLPVEKTRQPYVDLGLNYLDTGYKIVYQVLAAGRNPIILMPIQASTKWGPFAVPVGLARTVREVVRFLFARQLVASRTSPVAQLTLGEGRPTTFPPSGHISDEHVPESYVLTVSGFSAGINPVVSLCLDRTLDENSYPPKVFSAPPTALRENWHEIWDIDGVDTNGWTQLIKALNGWRQDSRRRLRSYHSQTTYHPQDGNGLVEQARLIRKRGKAGYVEQGTSRDGGITWVHFSDSYLTGDTKAPGHIRTLPEFGTFDAHHMVPAIAFGHAAGFQLP